MPAEIYLDANATSPILPAAIAAAERCLRQQFGNPSSTHAAGLKAKAMLEQARSRAARVLGAGAGRVIFTSGATESIQTAVLSALCAMRERATKGARPTLLLYGATEHKAVPESLAHWNRLLGTGLELRALPVDASGRHDLDVLRQLAPRAALVCTMAANNETGVVSDIAAIERVLIECASPALWLVDSVQALGKIALDLAATRIDYASFSGHKLYAPKGTGLLYVRQGAPYTALMAGGGQEGGQRAGTENMAGIAALDAVLAALEEGSTFASHAQLGALRARLVSALCAALPGVVFNAPLEAALPTTLNFSVPGVSGKELLDLFDAAGVRVSSGSACSSAKAAPSYVLEAMGLPAWRCANAIRMSFGPLADGALIDAACARIARCGQALRATCLVSGGDQLLPPDSVVSWSCDGAIGWLVCDPDSRQCALIDPPPALAGRIAAYVRGHRLQLQAVLATDQARAAGCAALAAELDGALDGAAASDALGWPAHSSCLQLDDGMLVNGVQVGARVLARLPGEHTQRGTASYLFGLPDSGANGVAGLARADVQCAFGGELLAPASGAAALPDAMLQAALRLARQLHRDTILCPVADDHDLLLTTCGAESAGHGVLGRALAALPALARPAQAPLTAARQLDATALERFLSDHPNALLIDVREPFEQAANAAPAWHGRVAQCVPLSRLAARLPGWLHADGRPLVFFCRAGNRSARVAQCAHRLGLSNVWQVTGGLALGDAVLQQLTMAA